MKAQTIATLFTTLLAAPAIAQAPPLGVPLKEAVPHITTTGFARAEIVPDQADIFLGVSSEDASAAGATEETAKAATTIIAEIKARGLDARDVKTTAFDLVSLFDEEHDPQGRVTKRTPRGFKARETLSLRVRDVTKAGGIARALIDKGANEFSGITFSSSKALLKQKDLEADAMRDALAEAKIYTDAVGLKLGRPLVIGEDGGEPNGGIADLPGRRSPPTADGQAAIVIPIEPGVQVLSATIKVVWEIRGALP